MRFPRISSLIIATTLACEGAEAPPSHDSGVRTSPMVQQPLPTLARNDDICLISTTGVGPIRLGMTLDEARKAIPRATFKRTSDGDGAALVEVAFAPDSAIVLYADEGDAEAAIDWSKHITNIETSSTAFHTSAGVRPGALVTEVERVYGKTRLVTLSEIESRQYIEFETQPAELTLRLDYTGVFKGDERTTKATRSGARIWSISVSAPRR